MRWTELIVTDIADGIDPVTRTEWIHRDHIIAIRPYTTHDTRTPMLWLELTLTSADTRYVPVAPVHPDLIDDAARSAIATLLETGTEPARAAALIDPN